MQAIIRGHKVGKKVANKYKQKQANYTGKNQAKIYKVNKNIYSCD